MSDTTRVTRSGAGCRSAPPQLPLPSRRRSPSFTGAVAAVFPSLTKAGAYALALRGGREALRMPRPALRLAVLVAVEVTL